MKIELRKVEPCVRCRKGRSTQENAAYGSRCEDCWVGNARFFAFGSKPKAVTHGKTAKLS